ncbi:hypothetical protein [Phaffia rhodozyma]|uniref:Uncharacterized protein n=1 Tax=Phaffia rhodozyma TaxID=264483 RepID=A0A0F7SQI3_PHARH|nr:hypothetical protein [Phaffia rhodozyma]
MSSLPPPPYTVTPPKSDPTLATMPFEVLQRIFHFVVSARPTLSDRALARWSLVKETRLVSTIFYKVIQAQLRTLLLQSYLASVRPPFSSTFVQLTGIPSQQISIVLANCPLKETQVLDLFIAAATREKAEHIESDLYEEMNWRNDLFLFNQPSARLTDLLLASPLVPSLPFSKSDLSVSFTPRRVTLHRTSSAHGGKRTELLKLDREKGEQEDVVILKLIEALKHLRASGGLLVDTLG